VLGSDRTHFAVGCDAMPCVTRSYHRFRETAEEIGMNRIYGGIHFMSANRDGQAIGEFVVANILSPAAPSHLAAAVLESANDANGHD
jgi:hypothetical protein